MRLPSLAATIAAIAAATPASQAPTAPTAPTARPCGAAEYRQFDFWIGEWEVLGRDGSIAGRNRVESIEGGCGVQENWTATGGGTGRSINTYSPGDKQWHQHWLGRAAERAQAALVSALAGLALLLAAIGLYGLVANGVAARTRELGIRLALGASSRQAIAVAAIPGIALAAIGVAIGLVAARLGADAMRHLVWGVSLADPLTFAAAGLAVFVVAAIASLAPALRIARLNPVSALRDS